MEDNRIHAIIIGTGVKSTHAGDIISGPYNDLIKTTADSAGIVIDYYVGIWEETEEYHYSDVNAAIVGKNVCRISDVGELYTSGRIGMIIVPQGVYTCAIPLLIMDGVRKESIYYVTDGILSRSDFSTEEVAGALKPLDKIGYMHTPSDLPSDNKVRYMGKRHQKCKICETEGDCDTYLAREMMQDKRDEFEYFVCPNCYCLQIENVPDNLGDYYGKGYYSFSLEEDPDRQYDSPIINNDKILDVGCGSGVWLVRMAIAGFSNLHGVDPFLEKDIHHGDRVSIRSCSIHELDEDGTYDYIRFSDSFEHVTDPHEVLKSTYRLLKDNGTVEIIIPTYPNIAFDLFGPHWYQLDAPRHISLHSVKSMKYLAEQNGFRITKIDYDSNAAQLYRSYMYMHGIPFFETDKKILDYINKLEIHELECISKEADKRKYGDHMTVWLAKE